MTEISSRKQEQRAVALEQRKGLGSSHAAEAAAALFMKTIPLDRASFVSLYMPIGNELGTQPLMTKLASLSDVIFLLPVIVAKAAPLIFRCWRPGEALEQAGFNTLQPSSDAPVETPDVLVVPLLAFDERGYRMGYGGGFYDRTLAELRKTKDIQAVGYAFEGQLVEEVIVDVYDQQLDWIVTEDKVRKFR